jgi:hypothetical protein
MRRHIEKADTAVNRQLDRSFAFRRVSDPEDVPQRGCAEAEY